MTGHDGSWLVMMDHVGSCMGMADHDWPWRLMTGHDGYRPTGHGGS